MNGKTTLPRHLSQTIVANAHRVLATVPIFDAMPIQTKRPGSIPSGSHLLDQVWRQPESVPLTVTTMSRHLLLVLRRLSVSRQTQQIRPHPRDLSASLQLRQLLLRPRGLSTLLQIQQLRLCLKGLSASLQPRHLLLLLQCRSTPNRRRSLLRQNQKAPRESVLEDLSAARATPLFTTLLGWIRTGRLPLHQRCRHARRQDHLWPTKDGPSLTLLTLLCDLICRDLVQENC